MVGNFLTTVCKAPKSRATPSDSGPRSYVYEGVWCHEWAPSYCLTCMSNTQPFPDGSASTNDLLEGLRVYVWHQATGLAPGKYSS